ncbi:type II toxin-antitoxin system HipA family toxin [Prevotella sp.]|uniref:type II toxin-antitoxin system HipA family toxin n=1 Tax=Prevotella sp. TaxID=59823 RepID=UPI003AF91F91
MRDIKCCPSTLAEGYCSYSPIACKRLFDGKKVSHMLDFEIDEISQAGGALIAMKRISVSGVQEKFPAVVDNGIIRISLSEERSRYILKPAPWDNTLYTRKQIPANEHLTMQIASQVYGVVTAENGLCFTPHGDMVYITKRFDVAEDGSKYYMEDFASLLCKSEAEHGSYFKYEGSFEDVARMIIKYIPAWMVAMERFFRLVVFNYIYGNGDDHLKNFSIIKVGNSYRLAPAYDLMNTCLHIEGDDFGLNGGLSLSLEKSDVYDRTGHPCRLDFERFGEFIGLKTKRMNTILDAFSSLPMEAKQLVGNSFLDDKMKRTYLRIVNERIARFNRKSE